MNVLETIKSVQLGSPEAKIVIASLQNYGDGTLGALLKEVVSELPQDLYVKDIPSHLMSRTDLIDKVLSLKLRKQKSNKQTFLVCPKCAYVAEEI